MGRTFRTLCPFTKSPVFYIKEWWYGGADGAGLSSLVLARVQPRGGAGQLPLLLEQEQSKHSPVCYWSLCWPPTGNQARVGLSSKERHREKKTKKKIGGENSCAVVEVGIKNDAEQRGKGVTLFWGNCEVCRGGIQSPDGSEAGGGESVTAVLGLKAQASVCCGTERMALQSRGSNLTVAAM